MASTTRSSALRETGIFAHRGARAQASDAPSRVSELSSPDQPRQGGPHREAYGKREHPGPRR
jgi:hypothetical protein